MTFLSSGLFTSFQVWFFSNMMISSFIAAIYLGSFSAYQKFVGSKMVYVAPLIDIKKWSCASYWDIIYKFIFFQPELFTLFWNWCRSYFFPVPLSIFHELHISIYQNFPCMRLENSVSFGDCVVSHKDFWLLSFCPAYLFWSMAHKQNTNIQTPWDFLKKVYNHIRLQTVSFLPLLLLEACWVQSLQYVQLLPSALLANTSQTINI